MNYFYSATTGGFYLKKIHGKNIPVDAVEITEAEYGQILAGQSAGNRIIPDDNGKPILAPPLLPSNEQVLIDKIKELKDEGLGRINLIMTVGDDWDILGVNAEMWSSIPAASRNPTGKFKSFLDHYQAGEDALVFINKMAPSDVSSYDVINTPSWP